MKRRIIIGAAVPWNGCTEWPLNERAASKRLMCAPTIAHTPEHSPVW